MPAVQGDATDEMLMVRYQRGEAPAFAELVRRHSRAVYNFVLRQLRDANLSEDVTQEVFLRVVQRASEFKHEARFSTWLYSITRNLCVDHLRRLSHRKHASLDAPRGGAADAEASPLVEQIADPHPRASAERGAQASQMQTSLLEALHALPDDQREVFLLREIANLPFKEIAEITDTPENTVKSRMRYALDRLRETLREFEEYARALR
ncbi:MAG TPA: RNA polymerase sigma factor [Polyangiaceae bacterium]|nr:RNA polymerase sigma factor [Polyangiaceae bacterium]